MAITKLIIILVKSDSCYRG